VSDLGHEWFAGFGGVVASGLGGFAGCRRPRKLSTMPDLSGKVAIVTGGGRGIGREHALALARAGACVVINDLGASVAGEGSDASPAHEVVAEIQALGGEAIANGENVADFAGAKRVVDQAIEKFGRLDILVNNAGNLRNRMLVNIDEHDWDAVISVHLKGHFAPTRHAAAYWHERSAAGEQLHARVITTSSGSGLFGNVGHVNYSAAKAGIIGFTLGVAQELGRYGVTANVLAPNARTRMTESVLGAPPKDGFDPVDPANSSPIVVALCADEAQDITGQVFLVYRGAVNVLRGWEPGVLLSNGAASEPDALLHELRKRFPDGLAPVGLRASMEKAGGPRRML
jgi:NAD(P)-dependent dehydrogenase (short-subunit alcohol dehydrogenase family)